MNIETPSPINGHTLAPHDQELSPRLERPKSLQELIAGVLIPQDLSQLDDAIEALRLSFPIRRIAVGLSDFTRRHKRHPQRIYIDNMIRLLNNNFRTRKMQARQQGEDFQMSDRDEDDIMLFFIAIEEMIPLIRRDHYETDLRSAVANLLYAHPEAEDLVSPLVTSLDQSSPRNLYSFGSTLFPGLTAKEIDELMRKGNAREVLRAFRLYGFLQNIFKGLSHEKKIEVLEKLGKRANSAKMQAVLRSLFSVAESDRWRGELQGENIRIGDLARILDNEAIYTIIDILLEKPDEYRFQLGSLLSIIPLSNLPGETVAKLKPQLTNLEYSIIPEYEYWCLCPEAEPRLDQAMKDKAAILVDDIFLLKFTGKLSALALKTVALPNGDTIVEGMWYSPVSRNLKAALRRSFDERRPKIYGLEGKWAVIRPIVDSKKGSSKKMIEKAERYSADLPEQLPEKIRGITRREYRLSEWGLEDHDL